MQNGLLNLAVGCHKRLHKARIEFSIILLGLRVMQNKSLLSLLTGLVQIAHTESVLLPLQFLLITVNASHQITHHLKQEAADIKTEIQNEINSTDLPKGRKKVWVLLMLPGTAWGCLPSSSLLWQDLLWSGTKEEAGSLRDLQMGTGTQGWMWPAPDHVPLQQMGTAQ